MKSISPHYSRFVVTTRNNLYRSQRVEKMMEKVKSFKPCERGMPAVTAAGGWRRLLMVLDVLGVEEGRWRRKKERKKERDGK